MSSSMQDVFPVTMQKSDSDEEKLEGELKNGYNFIFLRLFSVVIERLSLLCHCLWLYCTLNLAGLVLRHHNHAFTCHTS